MDRSKINSLLKVGRTKLTNISSGTASLEAEILLAHAMNCTRYQLFLLDDTKLNDAILTAYDAYLTMRMKHTPIAYITNSQEFYSYDFYVNESTLIPRHDSETLIDAAKGLYDSQSQISILDLGTGSGALGLTLLKEFPHASATLLDKSEQALSVAIRNAIDLQVSDRAIFIKSDWFSAITDDHKFDLIISNPPYIAKSEHLDPQVYDHEPHSALFADDEGDRDYKIIAQSAIKHLKPSSYLIFEIGINKEKEICNILAPQYKIVALRRDMSGVTRCIIAQELGFVCNVSEI